VDSTVGSCGFIFALFPSLHPAKLIRIDPKTGEIVRGRNGLAMECKPGQLGHIVGKVVEDSKFLSFGDVSLIHCRLTSCAVTVAERKSPAPTSALVWELFVVAHAIYTADMSGHSKDP